MKWSIYITKTFLGIVLHSPLLRPRPMGTEKIINIHSLIKWNKLQKHRMCLWQILQAPFLSLPYLDYILTWYDSWLSRVTRPSLANHPSWSKVSRESVSVHFNKAYVHMITILAPICEVTSLSSKEEMGKASVCRCVWEGEKQ